MGAGGSSLRAMPSRRFKPYLLAELGGHLLVVDEKQPVALLLGPDDRVIPIASWSHLAPPPQPFDYDRRRLIYVQQDRVCVGPIVRAVGHSQQPGWNAHARAGRR